MRFDGSDVSSIGAIAFGSLLGLMGTGVVLERLADAPDTRSEQRIEVRAVQAAPTTTLELLDARADLQLRPRFRTSVDLRDGPVIFVDGVRLGTGPSAGDVLDDVDPNDVERVTVLQGGAGGRGDPEIHIELKH